MRRLIITQLSRRIAEGGGASGVAYALEKAFLQAGYRVKRYELRNILSRRWVEYAPRSILWSKSKLLIDVLVYTIWGSIAVGFRYRRADVVSICHGDILFGDIYVNHGLHKKMLFDSGRPIRMLLRNPLHVFLLIRESLRHRLGIHRRIVCFSEFEKMMFAEVYPSSIRKLRVIPNGVDVVRFNEKPEFRHQMWESLALPERSFSLMFVGHEFDRKGLSFVLDALVELPAHVRLIVVGGVDYMQRRYRKLACARGVDERVAFLGVRDDIECLLNVADAFVLPTSYEAWPLVGLEAMACGTPALMTPVGGIPEFLADGENGFFIKRDPKDIAEKVMKLMDDPELLQTMRSRARETALRYSWDKVAEQYLSLIQEVAEEKARRA